MPDAAVNAVAHAVFDHFNRFGRIFAREELGTDFKAFAPARCRIRTVIDAAGPRGLHQKAPQKRTIGFNAGGLELRHQPVAVLVDDEAGESVSFTENQTNGVRAAPERFAKENGFPDLALKPRVINDFVLAIGPAARPQRGGRRIRSPGEKTPVARKHTHRIARYGLADHALNRGVVYPGVPAKKGLFLALFQNKV